ncbi:MAG: hemerythrin domain-containing protein [Vulcanimicrobiaceae bacterium]
MKLTVLRSEHEIILKEFAFIETELPKCTEHARYESLVAGLLSFIDLYIDKCHHGKEEGSLFPKLLSNAFLHDIPNVLSEEHVHARYLAGKISQASGDKMLQIEEIANYADFMRHHIRLENEMIFDAIEAGLDESSASDLHAEFVRVEMEAIRCAGVESWNRLIQHPLVEIGK